MPLPSHVVGGTIIASAWGNQVVDGLPQIGFVGMWAGDTAPTDYLMCRGQAVSRTTYAGLFAMCGVRFGAGDTSTTFNLPDMRGRYPVGYNVGGAYFTAGVGEKYGSTAVTLPAHQHPGANHLHGFAGTTVGATARHIHGLPSIVVIQATAAPTFYVHVTSGGGFDIAATQFDLSGLTTGTDGPDHAHEFSGATTGADRDLTTGIAGGDASLGNLPPSLSLNFIVRAL